jgi:hypothetical protein
MTENDKDVWPSWFILEAIAVLSAPVYFDIRFHRRLTKNLSTFFSIAIRILLPITPHPPIKCGSLDLPFYLSIITVLKNEGPYLAEWIEYHLLVGVEKFELVLNNNEDNSSEVLQPYVSMGVVRLGVWNGTNLQEQICTNRIRRFDNESCWVAIIDADEFLVPRNENHSVPQALRSLESFPGVRVNWVMFGTNGKKFKEDGLVIERFSRHTAWGSPRNRQGKTIVNPRMVRSCIVHDHFFVKGRSVNVKGKPIIRRYEWTPAVHEILWINHYWTKSEEEFRAKRLRGSAHVQHPGLVRERMARFEKDIKDHPDVVANASGVEWAIPLVKENLAKRYFYVR